MAPIYSLKEYIKVPTSEEWKEIAREFFDVGNSPKCLGAVYGKHVAMMKPPNVGSFHDNYKFFSSSCDDASTECILVHCGGRGSRWKSIRRQCIQLHEFGNLHNCS
ncbi:hypothetical protein JTB14_037726 [Gonioctena quinquepunctata]|nr:hypothetical protein JTB14_037726 [Gonioctena quinquepunctata]